ncbi:hypothetical protein EBL85_11895 [Marichromatium sp. AB32]|nr:hypothetical protein EBL85_11895 [Marichromatium sp. AB32]
MEAGGWRLKAGSWRLTTNDSQKNRPPPIKPFASFAALRFNFLEAGGWRLEAGGWRLEAENWQLNDPGAGLPGARLAWTV